MKNILNILENTINDIYEFIVLVIKLIPKLIKSFLKHKNSKTIILISVIIFIVIIGSIIIWISTFNLPNLTSFETRQVDQSTKIYDRTGEIVLYDIHGDIKRTSIPFDEISDYVKQATIAIEDDSFYSHNGIKISSIFRAALTNIKNGNLLSGQGGSTITQQVIKNALLTSDKKLSRKIKEWVLAPRLEKFLSKDEILNIYLNEVPYGGNVYGIQEASLRFFGKDANSLTLPEAAYLAALPQAPTYFSPYGNHLDDLEKRKNEVLRKMYKSKYITREEYEQTKEIEVSFEKPAKFGIRAPHFVFYVREILEEQYGKEIVEKGGLKVITTLDWELQEKAEEIAKRYALENEVKFNAENASIVAIDPTNGNILTMVGSRDYFDEDIDGNFNIATAHRQPGSTFKPIVYAEAFNKGYIPETVVYDVSTEFSATCSRGGNCYRPVNYDGKYNGLISFREALAQSVNIPAVKALYLAGLDDSLDLARRMGISSLKESKQYGLTLVLGGGEVSPLDITSAYGVFANDGVLNKHNAILSIQDQSNEDLEEREIESEEVLSKQTARMISDVLSDEPARVPAFGSNSYLNVQGRDVAAKTGTTNDYRDAWIIGYTPNLVITAWAGNNDNSSMDKKVAGFIVAPMWREFMDFALQKTERIDFIKPQYSSEGLNPMISGQIEEGPTHSILHFVNKRNPTGPSLQNPEVDPQYNLWEASLNSWSGGFISPIQQQGDSVTITNPEDNKSYNKNSKIYLIIKLSNPENTEYTEVLINNELIGTIKGSGTLLEFTPSEIENIKDSNNKILVKTKQNDGNIIDSSITFSIID